MFGMPCLRRQAPRAENRSFRLDVGRSDHPAPFLGFGRDMLSELGRRRDRDMQLAPRAAGLRQPRCRYASGRDSRSERWTVGRPNSTAGQ
jgi:hypothetical protein